MYLHTAAAVLGNGATDSLLLSVLGPGGKIKKQAQQDFPTNTCVAGVADLTMHFTFHSRTG